MAIEELEFRYEKEYLKDTFLWIQKEENKIKDEDERLKGNIEVLRKQSKGSYSEELEIKEKLYTITHKNMEKYSEVKKLPYFGRIDFREKKREEESFYIGKFGLGDMNSGEERVIDWRAPIADLYYSGTQGECYYVSPAGVINGELSLKRKFRIKDQELIDVFDEGINEIILKGEEATESSLKDEFLRINLEESISSKLKDVVATIQKEQNNIIRADKNTPLIVQGSAGSGKTTVALHRLAYIIYKYKNSVEGKEILVVAPNKIFLDYISEVLPGLGVDEVKQKTFEDLSCEILKIKSKIYTKDKKLAEILESNDEHRIKLVKNTAKLKGSNGFRVIIDRYIELLEHSDAKVESIKVMDYIMFERREILRLYLKDMVKLPLNKRKEEIKKYFMNKIDEKTFQVQSKIEFEYEIKIRNLKKEQEDSLDRREVLTKLYDERDVKKSKVKKLAKDAIAEYFKKWAIKDIYSLYLNLFNDEQTFDEVTSAKIPTELYDHIKDTFIQNHDKNIIDSDDIPALMYLKFKIDEVPLKYKYKHIVIDEAQDYSILQFFVMKEMSINNSITLVGDIAQGIYFYKGIEDWSKLSEQVFENGTDYVQLTQSYRSTIEIIEFANKVLSKQKVKLESAIPVLRHGMEPKVEEFHSIKEFCEKIDSIVDQVREKGKNSIAVIGRTIEECIKVQEGLKKHSKIKWELIKDTDKKITFEAAIIPSYMAKGLEFDCVVVYNCNKENYFDQELDKKLLYVVLTRALHMEYIFYNGEKSILIE